MSSVKNCDTCAHVEVSYLIAPCAQCIQDRGAFPSWEARPADEQQAEKRADEGRKDDDGKDPWSLAPFDAFRAIVQVLKFGASKYSDRNWEKGMNWSRPFSACMRHLTSWWEGEKADPETGYSHLWHAGCCVVFLIAYEIRGVGKDDRPEKSC